MMNKFLYITGLILLLSVSSHAQNAKEDFQKMQNAMKSDKLSMEMVYQVFKSENETVALQTEIGKMIQDGNKSYLKLGDIEMIRTENYNLMADHEMKLISLLAPERSMGNTEELFKVDLEKTLGACEKVEFLKAGKSNGYLLNLPPASEYKAIKIFFHPKTFLLERMELYYRNPVNLEDTDEPAKDKPKLVIQYKNINTNPVIDASVFLLTTYLKKENGKYKCLDKYKEYELINQLENN